MDNLKIVFDPRIKPLNAGLFVSSGRGTHPTRVIDSYEIIYVNRGVLEIFEENEKFKLNAGNALLLYPGLKHGGLADYPPDLSFYWIHFRIEKKANGVPLEIPKTTFVKQQDKLIGFLRAFLDEQENGTLSAERGACLIMLMFLELNRREDYIDDNSDIPAVKAKEFIDSNFREAIGTSDIALKLNCNADYLGRVFGRKYKLTITDYIHSKRISYATKKLVNGTMNINEISLDSGFSDTTYFRRIFKRITGLTPAKYRKIYSHVYVNTE